MAFRITVDTGEWARIAAAMSAFNTACSHAACAGRHRCIGKPIFMYRCRFRSRGRDLMNPGNRTLLPAT
jgi:hypothetical protein